MTLLPRRARLRAFAGTTLVIAVASLDQTILATALPTIARDLGSLSGVSWLMTGYLLASTAVTPIFGRLSDLYGRRRLLAIALATYLGSALLCALGQDLVHLILLRIVQGIGGGGLMALGMTLVADLVEPRDRGRYQGYIAAVYAVASTAGPILGGFLTEHLSWRSVFLIALPVGIIAWLLMERPLRMLRPTATGESRIDYLGCALLIAGVSCFLLTLSWGGKLMPWLSLQTALLAGTSLVLIAGFLAWERIAAVPILPLALFRNPTMRIGLPAFSLGSMAMFVAIVYIPVQTQLVGGESAGTSGILLMPMMLGLSTGSWVCGRLVSATGRYRLYPILGAAGASILFLVLALSDADQSLWLRGLVLAALGMSLSSMLSILVLAVQSTVDSTEMGSATSTMGFFRSLGGAMAIAVAGAMLASGSIGMPGGGLPQGEALAALPAETRALLRASLEPVFDRIFLIAAALTAGGFLLTLFMEERPIPESGSG